MKEEDKQAKMIVFQNSINPVGNLKVLCVNF